MSRCPTSHLRETPLPLRETTLKFESRYFLATTLMHDPFSNSETPTVAETPNPSNVTLVCPIRGQITQTIDANNPPTLSELTRIVGGSFGRSDASYFQQTGSGPQPLNPNQNVSPGMTISVTHGYKGGKG